MGMPQNTAPADAAPAVEVAAPAAPADAAPAVAVAAPAAPADAAPAVEVAAPAAPVDAAPAVEVAALVAPPQPAVENGNRKITLMSPNLMTISLLFGLIGIALNAMAGP